MFIIKCLDSHSHGAKTKKKGPKDISLTENLTKKPQHRTTYLLESLTILTIACFFFLPSRYGFSETTTLMTSLNRLQKKNKEEKVVEMYFIKSLVKLFYFFYFTAVAIQFLLDDIILGSGKILVWSGRPCYLFFLVVPLFVDTGKEGP